MKNLADRMKGYEYVVTNFLTKKIPVIIRLDGKAFHSFLKNAYKPFDNLFMVRMINTAIRLGKEIQGFKLAYTQSDEINLLLIDYNKVETDSWFNYNISKIVSVSAGIASSILTKYYDKQVVFDSRCFNIPEDDVSNYFLWRAKDWKRNSLQMYARSFFSHKELLNKHSFDIHEMLHSIGKNWTTDLTNQQKNGTYILKDGSVIDSVCDNYYEIEKLWGCSNV